MKKFDSAFGEIELTGERKDHIFLFHPDVRSAQKYFSETLLQPKLIRRSKFDAKVIVFYRKVLPNKFLAILVKTGQRNFILTAYLTSKIQHKPL